MLSFVLITCIFALEPICVSSGGLSHGGPRGPTMYGKTTYALNVLTVWTIIDCSC